MLLGMPSNFQMIIISKPSNQVNDPLPTKLQKELWSSMLPFWTRIVNVSLSQGMIPDCLKIGQVTAILKNTKCGPIWPQQFPSNYQHPDTRKVTREMCAPATLQTHWGFWSPCPLPIRLQNHSQHRNNSDTHCRWCPEIVWSERSLPAYSSWSLICVRYGETCQQD